MNLKNTTWIFEVFAVALLFAVAVPAMLIRTNPLPVQLLSVSAVLGTYFWFHHMKTRLVPGTMARAQAIGALNRTHSVMLDLSNALMSIKNDTELLNLILKKAIEVVPVAEYGSILVLNSDGQLEFKAIQGFDERLFDVKLDPEESFQWRMTNGNFVEPMIIENIARHGRVYMEEKTFDTMSQIEALNLRNTLSAPILINGRFYGSINVDSVESNVFTEQDSMMMMYFANQAASVIRNHELLETALYLSRYDDLTGVYNRRHFDEMFEDALGQCTDEDSWQLVILDLNGLKTVNDTLGHGAGDMMIRHFAQRLSQQVREMDLVARYGGDEFIAVFFNCPAKIISERLEQLRKSFRETPLEYGGAPMIIEFSYGVAACPAEAREYTKLVHLADERMYADKRKQKALALKQADSE